MEATSLESAVDSLLSPSVGGEPTQEDNLREAAESMVEPTQDAESEAIEAADEYEDDVDASDDIDVEDATEYTDEVEAVEDDSDSLFDVIIDGRQERWTLSQLKQSAAGQGYIQQKMRENAEQAKQIEMAKAQLAQQQQQVLQMAQSLQQGGLQAPTPPSRELFESDPIGYMEEKMKYDEAVQEYNAKVQQITQMRQYELQQTQAQRQAYVQEQAKLLAESIPEIVHPEKGDKIKRELLETGVAYGFSEQEMVNVIDHRYVRALNDARKWRQLQASKSIAQGKGENVKPVIKAGAKRRIDANTATRRKAQQELRKKGSVDAAMSLIIDPNL